MKEFDNFHLQAANDYIASGDKTMNFIWTVSQNIDYTTLFRIVFLLLVRLEVLF